MTSRTSIPGLLGGLFPGLAKACVLVLGGGLLIPAAAFGEDWLTYVDETDARISSDPSVGTDDVQEKDLAIGDVDQDGDTDLVVVRARSPSPMREPSATYCS
ncbi:MAG: hypothetical protein GY720_22515 [bacterium]|nr:hypothetical protein [bacterium]